MKRETFLPLTAVLAVFLIVFFSCKREMSFERKDPVKESRYWFNKTYDRLLSLKDGKLVGGNNYPDWRFAKVYKPKGRRYDIIEMPLIQKIKHRLVLQTSNTEKNDFKISSVKKLLIFTNGSNHHSDAIMTIVPDKEFLKTNYDISTINTENVPSNYNGYILFEKFDGRPLKTFKYKNGKIKSVVKLTPLAFNNSTTSIDAAVIRPPYLQDKCSTCEPFFTSGDVISNENEGTSCQGFESLCNMFQDLPENEDLMCEQDIYTLECNCGGMTVSSEGCSWIMEYYGDEGDGGGDTYNPDQGSMIIIDTSISSHYPCLDSLLQNFSDINITAQKIIDDIFGVHTKSNLTFAIDRSLDSLSIEDAYTLPGIGIKHLFNNGTDSFFSFRDTIMLNPYVVNRSTKEYLIATIFHEAIHAYINYRYSQYLAGFISTSTFINEFPIFWDFYQFPLLPSVQQEHELMALAYRDRISTIIKTYFNPSASTQLRNSVSDNLAWGGLNNTTAWRFPGFIDTCTVNNQSVSARNAYSTFIFPATSACSADTLNRNKLGLSLPCN
ncbi:MAG: hypothetical protein WCJ85_03005 [Chitinophagaceae bacterium]